MHISFLLLRMVFILTSPSAFNALIQSCNWGFRKSSVFLSSSGVIGFCKAARMIGLTASYTEMGLAAFGEHYSAPPPRPPPHSPPPSPPPPRPPPPPTPP